MHRQLITATVALAILACHSSPTAPPSGLPVALTFLSDTTPSPLIDGAGDSAVVRVSSATIPNNGCFSKRIDAGIEFVRTLVVTITRTNNFALPCAFVYPSPFTVRLAVHAVPPAPYTVVLIYREDFPGGDTSDHELARGPLSLP